MKHIINDLFLQKCDNYANILCKSVRNTLKMLAKVLYNLFEGDRYEEIYN